MGLETCQNQTVADVFFNRWTVIDLTQETPLPETCSETFFQQKLETCQNQTVADVFSINGQSLTQETPLPQTCSNTIF